MLLYPLAAALFLLTFLEPVIGYRQPLYIGAMIGALSVSLVDALASLPDFLSGSAFIQNLAGFYTNYIPLFKHGLGWVLPVLLGAFLGFLVSLRRGEQKTL